MAKVCKTVCASNGGFFDKKFERHYYYFKEKLLFQTLSVSIFLRFAIFLIQTQVIYGKQGHFYI